MRAFLLSAMFCVLTLGIASIGVDAAFAAKQSVKAGCHVHGKILCCPGGCIDPRRKNRRAASPRGCHWHGAWVCCPGFDCIDTDVVIK